jgi:hypothetical protein
MYFLFKGTEMNGMGFMKGKLFKGIFFGFLIAGLLIWMAVSTYQI